VIPNRTAKDAALNTRLRVNIEKRKMIGADAPKRTETQHQHL